MVCPWPLAPLALAKLATTRLWPQPTPLLEEEGHVRCDALISDRARPFGLDRAGAGAAFAADDDPVDAVEVEVGNRANQRFE